MMAGCWTSEIDFLWAGVFVSRMTLSESVRYYLSFPSLSSTVPSRLIRGVWVTVATDSSCSFTEIDFVRTVTGYVLIVWDIYRRNMGVWTVENVRFLTLGLLLLTPFFVVAWLSVSIQFWNFAFKLPLYVLFLMNLVFADFLTWVLFPSVSVTLMVGPSIFLPW